MHQNPGVITNAAIWHCLILGSSQSTALTKNIKHFQRDDSADYVALPGDIKAGLTYATMILAHHLDNITLPQNSLVSASTSHLRAPFTSHSAGPFLTLFPLLSDREV